ncbi:hypothetical protein EG329_009952 [Mollisiaceae sp. DMI_Dod_QoI]|nr:hypothetical protein EG329_009952 [Helotiales sp. DMI_Dod_QoI]
MKAPGARVHGYDTEPITFVIEPFFPANVVTDFINTFFSEVYALISLVLHHPVDGLFVLFNLLGYAMTRVPVGVWIIIAIGLIVSLFVVSRRVAVAVSEHLDAGEGGTPATIGGWWRLWRLRLMGQINIFKIHVDPFLKPYRGILHAEDIPARTASRPTIIGISPQRQRDQKTSIRRFEIVKRRLSEKADKYARDLVFETSFLESLGGTTGLKVRKREHDASPAITNRDGTVTPARAAWSNATPYTSHPKRTWIKQFGYEIAHAHHVDGSLHVILHPEDVRTVIEQGWGERHPVACTSWYWLTYYNTIKHFFYTDSRPPIPETLVFLYSPKDDAETDIVMRIVDAAIWYFTGEEVGANVNQGPDYKDRYRDEADANSPKTQLEEVTKAIADPEYDQFLRAAEVQAAADATSAATTSSKKGFWSRFSQKQRAVDRKGGKEARKDLVAIFPDGLDMEDQASPKLVVITDLAKDYDDLAAMVVLKELHRIGLVQLRGFVANLMPADKRALFGRGALDALGLQDIPIAVGLPASTDHHKELDYELKCSFNAPENTALENGNSLLRQLCATAKKENEKLTFVLLSSLADIFEFSKEYKDLNSIIAKVFLQGGHTTSPLKPDMRAANNKFHKAAAEGFYDFLETEKIPSSVYTKIATFATPVSTEVFDDMAATGHPVGQHLQQVRVLQDTEFYKGACQPNPPFMNQQRFLETKSSWFDTPHEPDAPLPVGDEILPYLTKVVVYDALPALASSGADVLEALNIKAPSSELHEIVGITGPPDVPGIDGDMMARALGALLRGSLLAAQQGKK